MPCAECCGAAQRGGGEIRDAVGEVGCRDEAEIACGANRRRNDVADVSGTELSGHDRLRPVQYAGKGGGQLNDGAGAAGGDVVRAERRLRPRVATPRGTDSWTSPISVRTVLAELPLRSLTDPPGGVWPRS